MTQKEKATAINNIMKYAHSANSKYFNGRVNLKSIEFKLSARMINVLGLYRVKANQQSITLSHVVLKDEYEWRNTVTHELVHAWQYQTGKTLSHGHDFKSKAAEIFKIDPNMIITSKARNEKISNLITSKKLERAKNSHQYLLKRPNGSYGFMKNLDNGDVKALYQNKFEVFRIKSAIARVQHYQSLKSCFNAAYSYDKTVLNRVYPTLFKNDIIPVLYS